MTVDRAAQGNRPARRRARSRCSSGAPALAQKIGAAKGRRRRLPAGAGERRSCGASREQDRSCRRRTAGAVFREIISACRGARGGDPRLLPRARGHVQRAGGAQALRPRGRGAAAAPRSTRRSAARESGARAVHRGAGGEFHRRRGRPHARSAAHHAAAHLRRSRAAGAAESAVEAGRTEGRSSSVYSHSQSLAQCNGWLAQNLPQRGAHAGRFERRGGAARARRRRARPRSPARPPASATGSTCWRARIEDEPEQHHALPGARQHRPGAERQATAPRS